MDTDATPAGSAHSKGDTDPEPVRTVACGRLLLDATDPLTYADAVTDLLDVWADEGNGHHPRDGWPWSWPDSRETDRVFTFAHGQVWITTGRAWLPGGAPVANQKEQATRENPMNDATPTTPTTPRTPRSATSSETWTSSG